MPEFASTGNEGTQLLPLVAQFPPRVGQPYISGAPVSQGFRNNSQVRRLLFRIIESSTTQLFHCLANDSPSWKIVLVASAKVKCTHSAKVGIKTVFWRAARPPQPLEAAFFNGVHGA
jgi:hypothetical protein